MTEPRNAPHNVRNYVYVANDTRTLLVLYSFWLFVIASFLTTIYSFYALSQFNTAMSQQTQEAKEAFLKTADIYDSASGVVGLLFLICAIIFLFWIYRASNNTHALHTQKKIAFTPGWNVGCYFIPFLNLYWPYKGMKEIWLINVKNEENRGQIIGMILTWWLTFIFANIFANGAFKLSLKSPFNLEGYVALDAASNLLGIIAALFIIKMVKQINNAQKLKFKEVNTLNSSSMR